MNNSKKEEKELRSGDIISLSFSNEAVGHEQMGHRPAIIISAKPEQFNMIVVAPITNTDNSYPLHISLGNMTKTTGFILMEQIRSVDKVQRKVKFIEHAPESIIEQIKTVFKAQFQNLIS